MLLAQTTALYEKLAKKKKIKIEKEVKEGTEIHISYNHDTRSIYVYMVKYDREGNEKVTRYDFPDDKDTREIIEQIHGYFSTHEIQPSIGELMYQELLDKSPASKNRKVKK